MSESMEPGLKEVKGEVGVASSDGPALVVVQGDVLIFHVSKDPICVGEIIAFKVDEIDFLIVNRVIEVHEQRNTGKVYILTKGDNSPSDDRANYARGQLWLQRHHVIARVVGVLPYCGWLTIIVNEKPIRKYIFIVAMGLQAMIDD